MGFIKVSELNTWVLKLSVYLCIHIKDPHNCKPHRMIKFAILQFWILKADLTPNIWLVHLKGGCKWVEPEYSLLLKLEEDVEFVRRLDILEQIAHFFCPNIIRKNPFPRIWLCLSKSFEGALNGLHRCNLDWLFSPSVASKWSCFI